MVTIQMSQDIFHKQQNGINSIKGSINIKHKMKLKIWKVKNWTGFKHLKYRICEYSRHFSLSVCMMALFWENDK